MSDANIKLSTGTFEDEEWARRNITLPNHADHLMAVGCLQLMWNQRLKNTGYLDKIVVHYVALVGLENYFSADGKYNLEKVKEAMVKAQNEIHGTNATSFEQIVESR